jgi:hypothetical protein
LSRPSIPKTRKKVKRVSKSKPRKKSPAKRAKAATKKREKPAKKKAKRTRVSKPIKRTVKKTVKKTVKHKVKVTKRRSMNIHTPKKKTKKKVKAKKKPVKSRRERDLELTVSALRKMIPQALVQNILTETQAPKFSPLEDRVTQEEIDSVTRILEQDLVPEPDSDHDFIPIQPSIIDNMAPGVQRAIQLVAQYGTRLRNLDPEQLAFWIERNRTVRLIHDVTGIWDEGGNEREYMEAFAERQGKNTRAIYTDLLSPGDLEAVFAEPSATE